jgi:hypothetical protein
MTVPADPQHIHEVVDSIRDRLAGEHAAGGPGAGSAPQAGGQYSSSAYSESGGAGGPAHARTGRASAAWAHAKRAAARRDVQVMAGAAVLAAAAGAALQRGD